MKSIKLRRSDVVADEVVRPLHLRQVGPVDKVKKGAHHAATNVDIFCSITFLWFAGLRTTESLYTYFVLSHPPNQKIAQAHFGGYEKFQAYAYLISVQDRLKSKDC